MESNESQLANRARTIWTAAVDAVRPEPLVHSAVDRFPMEWTELIRRAKTVRVVGCGKAGAAMAAGLEAGLREFLPKITGLVNVPEGSHAELSRIRLHYARPAGSNHPTAAGVAGAEEMLRLLGTAEPDDVALCLLSGGGSALLPAPVAGITLEDKQALTKLLHACGATIVELNAVRKHLSRIKGGRMAEAFRGRLLVSLIISDVVGDPLDVIASGPTAADTSTFADAFEVLRKYDLLEKTPGSVVDHLQKGMAGKIDDTPDTLPAFVNNLVIGSNRIALDAATDAAVSLGYRVLDFGAFLEGESQNLATSISGIARSIRAHGKPVPVPACLLIGGETTVALGPDSGRGGRNQEFVLALLHELNSRGMKNFAILSGGTDGEDGPTDAAGAVATPETLDRARSDGLNPVDFLHRHDSYTFFDHCGGLLRTGLTGTNVMDVRIVLLG